MPIGASFQCDCSKSACGEIIQDKRNACYFANSLLGSPEERPQRAYDPARQHNNDDQQQPDYRDRRIRMLGGEPGEEDGKPVFSQT